MNHNLQSLDDTPIVFVFLCWLCPLYTRLECLRVNTRLGGETAQSCMDVAMQEENLNDRTAFKVNQSPKRRNVNDTNLGLYPEEVQRHTTWSSPTQTQGNHRHNSMVRDDIDAASQSHNIKSPNVNNNINSPINKTVSEEKEERR